MKWTLWMLMLPALASGTIRIVDAGGSGGYLTIQAAVDASGTDDVISIMSGIYHENVVVPYPSINLYILGEDPVTTIVDAGGTGKCFYFWFDGTGAGTISGLTLQNSGSGNADGMSNAGIALRGNTDGTFLISNCIFRDNPYRGVASAAIVSVDFNLFINNLSSSILIFGGSDAICYANTFINCESGIFYTSDASSLQILNNLFFDMSGRGIWASAGPALVNMCNDMWNVAIPYDGCSEGPYDFSLDPQFCGDPPLGNYYLQSDSPCADAQQGECGQVGAYPVDCGESAARSIDWGSLKHRY